MRTPTPTKHDRSRPKAQERLAFRLADVPAVVGLSLSHLRLMISRGEIRAVRHGKATLIPAAEVARLAGVA